MMTMLTLDRIREVAQNRIRKEGKVLLRLIDSRPYTDKIEELNRTAAENLVRIAQTETQIQDMEALRNKNSKKSKLFRSSDDILADVNEFIRVSDGINRLIQKKEMLERCNEQLAEHSKRMQSILNELPHFEKESYYVLKKEELLADKVLLCVAKYLDGSYYSVDDFVKRVRYGFTDRDKSFKRFAELTAKGIRAKDYRKSFSRIISWLLRFDHSRSCSHLNQYYCIPKDQELLFYSFRLSSKYPGIAMDAEDEFKSDYAQKNRLDACDSGDGLAEVHASDEFIEDAPSPFEYGSVSDRRLLHETFCKILIDMGTLEDAVQVATEYPDFVTPSDLVRRIEDALQTRERDVGERLLDILTAYEAAHPDVPRLKNELNRLDKILQLKLSTNFDLESLNQISGAEFEQLLALKFEELGFKVIKTPVTGDFGADLIIITPNETRISVQCKRFRNKVNLKAVQEVVASLSHYQCDFGIVVTNSSFLNSAKKLAENNEIELWDQDRLISFLSSDLRFSELHVM